jgi:hypothetical protein
MSPTGDSIEVISRANSSDVGLTQDDISQSVVGAQPQLGPSLTRAGDCRYVNFVIKLLQPV